MSDIKDKSTPRKSSPLNQDNKSGKAKAGTNKADKVQDKTPSKDSSSIEKKTPTKAVKIDKKTPVKEDMKKTSHKEPTNNASKRKSTDQGKIIRKREGLPLSRVKTVMKTARDAEGISPAAVQVTAVATELFIKHMMRGVFELATSEKKKKIDYNILAKYVNDNEKEELEFLEVLIPPKITVATYKKLQSKDVASSQQLDFLASESEESESTSDEENSSDSFIDNALAAWKTREADIEPSPERPPMPLHPLPSISWPDYSSEDDIIIL